VRDEGSKNRGRRCFGLLPGSSKYVCMVTERLDPRCYRARNSIMQEGVCCGFVNDANDGLVGVGTLFGYLSLDVGDDT